MFVLVVSATAKDIVSSLISYTMKAPLSSGHKEVDDNKLTVTYFWDGVKLGENEVGLNSIMEKIRRMKTDHLSINLNASEGSERINLAHTPPLFRTHFNEIISICRFKKINILLINNPVLWIKVPEVKDVPAGTDDFGLESPDDNKAK